MRRHLTPLLIVVAAWLLFAGPLLWDPGNLYLVDTAALDLPRRVFAGREMRQGRFPFWTDRLACGFPMHAEGQTQLLYPLHLLYVLHPEPKAHDVFISLHYLLAGLGMYAFLSRRCDCVSAAAVGAVIYMSCAPLKALHVNPPSFVVVTLAPWPLFFLERLRSRTGGLPWSAAAINGAMLLGGSPEFFLVSVVLQAGYYLFFLAPRRRWNAVLDLPIAFALPGVLAAAQLVPTYEYFKTSSRSGGAGLEQMMANTTSLLGLLYVGPFRYEENATRGWGVDLGWAPAILALGLAVVGVAVGFREKRELVFWVLAATLGVAIATGTPILWLMAKVPPFAWFRWPQNYLLLSLFAACVAATKGCQVFLAALSSRIHGRIARPFAAATVCAAFAVKPISLYLAAPGFYEVQAPQILAAAEANDDFRLWSRGSAQATAMLETGFNQEGMRAGLAACPADYSLMVGVPSSQLASQNTSVSPGPITELFFGAGGVPPPPWRLMVRWAGVTHVAAVDALESADAKDLLELAAEPVGLYRLRRKLPDAWMVFQTKIVPDPSERLRALADPSLDPLETAIIESPVELDPRPEETPLVRAARSESGDVVLQVDSPARGLLVVKDNHEPRIQAWLDGAPVRIERVNHAFRGVVVPPGRHTVAMAYWPRGFALGATISIAAWAMVAIMIVRSVLPRAFAVAAIFVLVIGAVVAERAIGVVGARPHALGTAQSLDGIGAPPRDPDLVAKGLENGWRRIDPEGTSGPAVAATDGVYGASPAGQNRLVVVSEPVELREGEPVRIDCQLRSESNVDAVVSLRPVGGGRASFSRTVPLTPHWQSLQFDALARTSGPARVEISESGSAAIQWRDVAVWTLPPPKPLTPRAGQAAGWALSTTPPHPKARVMPTDEGGIAVRPKGFVGKEPWDLQLNGPERAVVKGEKYLVWLRARASEPRPIVLAVSQAHEPWENLGLYEKRLLSPHWQDIFLEFDARLDEPRARLQIFGGTSDVDFEIDDVAFRPVHWSAMVRGGATVGLRPMPESPDGLRVEIGEVQGKSPYQIQLLSRPMPIEAHRGYTLRLEARAEKDRSMHLSVSQSREPFENLGLEKTADIGPEWRRLEYDFQATKSDGQGRVVLSVGSSGAPLEIRGFSLEAATERQEANDHAEKNGR